MTEGFGFLPAPLPAYLVALGAGLLIGIERERRKGSGADRAAAGLRTFAIVALLGATAGTAGLPWLAATLGAGVAALAAVGYWRSRSDDPGLTTEVAMLATFAIGVLAAHDAALAAGLGALVALLLAARSRLHAFAHHWLSDREVEDAILLAGAALIVLPLLPDRAIDPFGAINPHLVWRLTVLVMTVNAAGYLALRLAGPQWGLPFAGLLGGFVSSVATIVAMGRRSRDDPRQMRGALAGAALSSLATVLQLALVLAATHWPTLQRLALPLAAMGVVTLATGAIIVLRGISDGTPPPVPAGRAFEPRQALLFAAVLAVLLATVALLGRAFGADGVLGGAIVGGFLDTHSAAASVASLVAGGTLAPAAATTAIALAVSANTVTKLWAAGTGGGARFLARLAPGLLAMLAALWGGVLLAARA